MAPSYNTIDLLEEQKGSRICKKNTRQRAKWNFGHPFRYQQLLFNKKITQRFERVCTLDEHHGCVNTVQWNDAGTLIVSGSDDCYINIWDYPRRQLLQSISTTHTGNIFCAKFLPFSDDRRIISCAADGDIKHIQLREGDSSSSSSSSPIIDTFNSHGNMVHKLDIEPGSPHVFFSASKDGTVRQFDLRRPNDNNSDMVVNLKSLTTTTFGMEVDSISINPMKPNYFIIGGGDPYVRLYDRRMVRSVPTSGSDGGDDYRYGCVKKVAPSAIVAKHSEENEGLTPHITGVRYNALGTKAICTYSGDDIYLFDIHQNMPDPQDIQHLQSTSELTANGSNVNNNEGNEMDDEDEGNEDEDDEESGMEQDFGFYRRRLTRADLIDRKINQDCPEDNSWERKFHGHRNIRTVKEVNFYGPKSEYVISGSDCGHIFIWETATGDIVRVMKGDEQVVNCLTPNPANMPVIATSGIENDIKVWEPCAAEPHNLDGVDELVRDNENETERGAQMVAIPHSLLFNLARSLHREGGRIPADYIIQGYDSSDEDSGGEEGRSGRDPRECVIS